MRRNLSQDLLVSGSFIRAFGVFVCMVFGAIIASASPCTPSAETLDQAYRSIYNLDFTAATQELLIWENEHPSDPIGPASEAASYLFSELDRLGSLQIQMFADDSGLKNRQSLVPDPETKKLFYADIHRALNLANNELKGNGQAADALFSEAIVFGLKADYAALIEKRNTQALSYLEKGRQWSASTIAADPLCYDAYLGLGLENYLLGAEPMIVRSFLRLRGAHTDREKGIEELQLTAEKGTLLQPFAKLLLAIAALRDRDVSEARKLLEELKEKFPHNPLYQQELRKIDSKS